MEGDITLFSAQFQEKYGPLIDKLFSQITMADDTQLNARKQSELQENIERYTDFRTYLKFDLETTDQNGSKQLLSQTLNTKSGGETQTPFYIAGSGVVCTAVPRERYVQLWQHRASGRVR